MEGKKVFLNTKLHACIKDGIKSNEEYELFLDGQFFEAITFFEKMGYTKVRALKKRRTTFLFEDIFYHIDENFTIPSTLEIEA